MRSRLGLCAVLVGLIVSLAAVLSNVAPAVAGVPGYETTLGPDLGAAVVGSAGYSYDPPATSTTSTANVGSAATSEAAPIAGLPTASMFAFQSIGAAEGGVDIGSANFAQTTYGEAFSSGGRFAGQSIDDVAGALRSGELSAEDVPIEAINRDGNTLILNTRSAQALERAGIPRSEWNVVNVTGDSAAEARLSGQLGRNGLTSAGYSSPTSSGG